MKVTEKEKRKKERDSFPGLLRIKHGTEVEEAEA